MRKQVFSKNTSFTTAKNTAVDCACGWPASENGVTALLERHHGGGHLASARAQGAATWCEDASVRLHIHLAAGLSAH